MTKGGRSPSDVRDTPHVSGIACTIVVSGELGTQFDRVFADMVLSHELGATRIRGTLTDQAELQGVLRQIFDLGLEILSVSTHPGEMPDG